MAVYEVREIRRSIRLKTRVVADSSREAALASRFDGWVLCKEGYSGKRSIFLIASGEAIPEGNLRINKLR